MTRSGRISPAPVSRGSAPAIRPSSSIHPYRLMRPATSWSTGCSSSSATSRCRSTGTARTAGRFLSGVIRTGLRLARRGGADPRCRHHPVLPDGRPRPAQRWTFGRVTLLGDAAHPMYPQGGNGGAQAIIHAATLGRLLHSEPDGPAALRPMRRRGCRRPAAWCCRTARPRPTCSSMRSAAHRRQALREARRRHQPGRAQGDLQRCQKVAGFHLKQPSSERET